MVSFLSILAVGFFLGMRHATDPDHVIAVSTIVSREHSPAKSALIGAFWGVGHTVTVFVVGAIIILFNIVIPPKIGLSMELSVGFMLIILGVMNVSAFFRSLPSRSRGDGHEPHVTHSHAHPHGDYVHTHPHGHEPESHPHATDQTPLARLDRFLGNVSFYKLMRPLIIGIVHGLAGSAAVVLLVLTTIRDPRWAVGYLLVFGVGTIAGMMLITMSIASAFHWVGRARNLSPVLGMASGLLSLVFGCVLAYQIVFGHGFFTSHPQWSPH
jgi:ABC-type nickel/cobalt efflux system permease component RcnA